MAKYNEGLAHEDIREQLLDECAEMVDDTDDGPVFWLGLAKAQWECGALQDDVYQRVKTMIDTGAGLALWEEAGETTLRKRKQVLQEFLAKISTPKEKPRKRRKVIPHPSPYAPGDCLAIKLSNGQHGAAFVLAVDNDSYPPDGQTLVGLLDYLSPEKPALMSFEGRNWLRSEYGSPIIYWCAAREYKRSAASFELVGQVPLISTDYKWSNTFSTWERLEYNLFRQKKLLLE
jgi:hypothetical protein